MEHLESVAAFAVENPSRSSLIIETMKSYFTQLCGRGTGREGVIAREMSHPAYKPPLRFVLKLRLQKGHYCI